MQTNAVSATIMVIGNESIAKAYLNDWFSYSQYNSFRPIKKAIRQKAPALMVACINNDDDEKLAKEVIQYVREGLQNNDIKIALIHDLSFQLDIINWIEVFRVNVCLLANDDKRELNLTTLNREIDTYLYLEKNKRQHDAETEMLMCITQFSRENTSLTELIRLFSTSLTKLCYSSCSFHIKLKENNQGKIDYCNSESAHLIDELNSVLKLPKIPEYLQPTLQEKKAHINLLPDNIDLHSIEQIIGEVIGSYLTFPITVYDKTLYLLMYFIPENQMDNVSMKQINIINKACEQLTMLLERRQSENSLKKQYSRLKTTLVELNTTKQELQHKEKMANIGQMAAGIAHEINNPLSFVMSNFASMDEYLGSIIRLQELQSQFLDTIDLEQGHKALELKKNITQFEKDEDIAFILSDIRSVVFESHNGLKRVKNIITDLKSFTYSQSSELEVCNITQVIEDTLKVLSYDLDKAITIDKRLNELPPFMAHNGLMGQVLLNLIKNAGQALMEINQKQPKIVITTLDKDETIYIMVEDNGPGIPEEARLKIFDPFYTTKPVGEGTGLGLSVTFNIIKKLGGVIELESVVNDFTRFVISFPRINKAA